jgi:hypothetical protein
MNYNQGSAGTDAFSPIFCELLDDLLTKAAFIIFSIFLFSSSLDIG